MKEKLQIRCPFCGTWFTYRRGISVPKGEGFLQVKDIKEVPKFDLLDITTDTMVKEVIGRAVVGNYSLPQALLNLNKHHYIIIKRKLLEIKKQYNKINTIIKNIGG